MKKILPFRIAAVGAALLFAFTLSAQKKTTVTVRVEKDGKVVKDTTYQFDDAAEAEQALKMMDIVSGDDEHMMEYQYKVVKHDGDHTNTVVVVSEDGKKKEIKEFSGDSLVWITEGEDDAEHVKVLKFKGDPGENVMVVKSGDEETFDILIDEDEDDSGDEVKVIVVKKKVEKNKQ